MAWFRIDDQAAFHAKVLMAGNEAYGAWCRAGAWSSGHGTNGRIPRAVALTIAPERVWKRLVEARLEPGGNGLAVLVEDGWQIHDFLDWNPSAEEVRAERESLREARRRAGMAGGLRSGEARRAKQGGSTDEASAKQTRSNAEAIEEANGEARAKQNEAPIPIPVSSNNTPPAPPGGEAKADEAPADGTVEAARGPIEAELRKHRTFDALDVAAVAQVLAERHLTRAVSRGAKLEWVLTAIADCAADKAGAGLSAEALGKAVRAYVDRARAPTPPGSEGQARPLGQPRPTRGAPLIQQDREPPKWLAGKEF